LTHPRFLRLYKQILKPDGIIHLKTDSPKLYGFTKRVAELYGLSIVADHTDITQIEAIPELRIKTHYEKLDIAGRNTVHYLAFTLPDTIPDHDEALQEELKLTENPETT
jgi:tRNA (guanine-N7-)-methyltransferase